MTVNGLMNTIRYDGDVYAWALQLLDIGVVQPYITLQRSRAIKLRFAAVISIDIAIVYLMAIASVPLVLSNVLWFSGLLLLRFALDIPLKRMIAVVISDFIAATIPRPELEKMTLLQVGAIVHQRYRAPDLVQRLSGYNVFFFTVLLWGYTLLVWVLFFDNITRVRLLLALVWFLYTMPRLQALAAVFKISNKKDK